MLALKNNKSKKIALVILLAVLTTAAVLFILEKKQIINLYSKKSTDHVSNEAKTTSETPTAQDDFQSDEVREPGSTLDENKGSGDITDTGGSLSSIDTSNPVASKTGEITLYSPKKQSIIKSGHVIGGTSLLNTISYRLIDSVSGVIGMGEIKVVNGKFSGNLVFKTTAKEGRLDIYASRADGNEYSNIEIPLRFE